MQAELMAEEAQVCRAQAALFPNRPEQPFLLKLAAAFDELALEKDAERPRVANDRAPDAGQPDRHDPTPQADEDEARSEERLKKIAKKPERR
jgi:hypothetical protein